MNNTKQNIAIRESRRPRLPKTTSIPRFATLLAFPLFFLLCLVAHADDIQARVQSVRAAVEDLAQRFPDQYPGKAFLSRLDSLESALSKHKNAAEKELDALQREALLAHPGISGAPILFVSRAQYLPDHHNTETMFQVGEINEASFRGGSALKTIDFAKGGEVRVLLETADGLVRDPEVHFDGTRIVFAMRKNPKDGYHIYEMNADGSGVKQLTRAEGVTDIDPLYLPSGDIAFSATREPKYCMCNRHIMANLYRMEADGANIRQIGKNTLFEGHGSLLADGRILYDRWEYVDRNFGDAQGLWTAWPDGSEHAVFWGNNTNSPGAVLDARVLPGSSSIICTFSSCHDRPWGALALVDRERGLDGRAPVVRTWPPDAVNLVGQGDFDTYTKVKLKYEDPFPIDDKFFLCSRMTGRGEQMGLFLVDVFGNEILVYEDERGCFDPMPLQTHPMPPALPDRATPMDEEGTWFVADVYQGTHMLGVERGSVKWLRVIESPEKRSYNPEEIWGGQGQQNPAMNWHDFNNKRILGQVPVEEDGSAFFTVPARRFVYFQLLDAQGMMVQSMRSGAFLQPGEHSGCTGCHESRHSAPPPATAVALRALGRAPSRLEGWHGEPRMFNYLQEVQPVLDRYCVKCHDYGKKAGETLNLAGDRSLTFNASYADLWRKQYITVAGAGPYTTFQPFAWGSHASKIIKVVMEGHQGVQLDPESLDRLITWVDINAPYYPAYETSYPSNLAGRAPIDNKQLARLSELTGVPFRERAAFSKNQGAEVSFDRPEMSPCLQTLKTRDSSAYREALSIIEAGRKNFAALPGADKAGFQACETDLKRTARYEGRVAIETENRRAMSAGTRRYDE